MNDKEEILKKIKMELERMSCTDIDFPPSSDDLIVAIFNCREVTSFVGNIPGWTYSGIHLDPTQKRQYKIDFKKIS